MRKKGFFKGCVTAALVGLSSLMVTPSADARMQFPTGNAGYLFGNECTVRVTDGSTITFRRTGAASFTVNGVPYYGDTEGLSYDRLEMVVQRGKDDVTGDMVFLVTFADVHIGTASDGWLFAKMHDGMFHDIIKNDPWCKQPYEVRLAPGKNGAPPDSFSVSYRNHANPYMATGIAVWWDKKLNRWNYHG